MYTCADPLPDRTSCDRMVVDRIMDAELKQALAGMEVRLNRHVDERLETTETKLRQYVDERLETTETKLRQYVDERLENTETKLLTGFHNWAQTYEVRARGTSA